jgi:hypothetical protein
MYRALLAAALITAFSGAGSIEAATATKHHPRVTRPAAMQQPTNAYPSKPRWAAPQQCFTDDGYGRYTPCEGGGKGY